MDTQSRVTALQKDLIDLIEDLATEKFIDAFDVAILTLRLGLEGKKCATLTETGKVLQRSPEWIRSRQYLILKRKIRNPYFFQKLEMYSQYAKLPRGISRRGSQ